MKLLPGVLITTLIAGITGCSFCLAQPRPATTAGTAGTEAVVGTPNSTGKPGNENLSATAESAGAQRNFESWVRNFRDTARAAGISDATLRSALDKAQYLPRVVELDRAQPEFTRPIWDYLEKAVTAERVTLGKQKWNQHRAQASAAAKRFGVPASIVMAIWGIETHFGGHLGNTPIIDALATLGSDGRREAWARDQLLAALKILQNGDMRANQLFGSWAGAMGQTQFLPSNYLAFAIDADGDGRRDLFGSIADVTASTANFLASAGWRAGQPWGIEVRLPNGFDYARADPQLRESTSRWAQAGVTAMDGKPLPELDEAAILLPAGARGPAFLVGPNFRTILQYNNSTSYALAVVLLSQALAGGPGVQTPWPRDLQPLSRTQLIELQTALNTRGFDSGTPDGVLGPITQASLRRFQRSIGAVADAYPTLELLQKLQER